MKVQVKPKWETSKVFLDETYHINEGQPVYEKRFKHVLKFQTPGIAPVLDESGAYHIDISACPIYPERYTRTFGFYCNRASVNNNGEWFHLLPNGELFYKDRYAWCGNFQEFMCAVKDHLGRFFHIDERGARPYQQTFSYVGDFHDGLAVAQTDEGFHIHIKSFTGILYGKNKKQKPNK